MPDSLPWPLRVILLAYESLPGTVLVWCAALWAAARWG
jgi:hypothetical protein